MAKEHKSKIGTVMSEYKAGDLHSGSEHGPKVKSRAQAIAIGLSEARKAGEHVAPLEPAHHSQSTGNPAYVAAPILARGAQKSHSFGHPAHLRHGKLRVSGHPGAHRVGKRA